MAEECCSSTHLYMARSHLCGVPAVGLVGRQSEEVLVEFASACSLGGGGGVARQLGGVQHGGERRRSSGAVPERAKPKQQLSTSDEKSGLRIEDGG